MNLIESINPKNNEKINEYELFSDSKIREVIALTNNRFMTFKNESFENKSSMMLRAATILEERKLEFAEMMTNEMGKTLTSAIAEVEKCAWVCKYYAEKAESFLSDKLIETEASKSMVVYRPLGVILAVMPWNYPFWQVFRFAAPALMAGNTAILKHASNVSGCALLIQEVFEKAGFPESCFTTIIAKSSQIEAVIKNPKIRAATLTGSGPAGSSVASLCGKYFKKTVLELGGSDPYIVLEDADLDLAVDQCKTTRLLNVGQSCIGGKRFIIVENVYELFLEKFKTAMANVTIGDPVNAVDLGPMARIDLRDEVHEQVLKSVEKGAELVLGGTIPAGEGAYYSPTILTNVKPGMPAYDEEIFGPVAAVIKAKDVDDAIRIANDTEFGLGACVFTQDNEKGEDIAKNKLDAGCCFVNQFVKSDPRLPFGGIKNSGYGRELSENGIKEFVNTKTVYIR